MVRDVSDEKSSNGKIKSSEKSRISKLSDSRCGRSWICFRFVLLEIKPKDRDLSERKLKYWDKSGFGGSTLFLILSVSHFVPAHEYY